MSDRREELFCTLVTRKVRAELDVILPLMRIVPQGDVPADVMVLSDACQSGPNADVLLPEVADALGKALGALGWGRPLLAACTRAADDGPLAGEVLATLIEVVDPDLVVALDAGAARCLAAATGVERLEAGRPERVAGRSIVAIADFAGSLGDETRKRRVWEQLKTVRRD